MLVKDLSPTEALGTQNERLSDPFDMEIHQTDFMVFLAALTAS